MNSYRDRFPAWSRCLASIENVACLSFVIESSVAEKCEEQQEDVRELPSG